MRTRILTFLHIHLETLFLHILTSTYLQPSLSFGAHIHIPASEGTAHGLSAWPPNRQAPTPQALLSPQATSTWPRQRSPLSSRKNHTNPQPNVSQRYQRLNVNVHVRARHTAEASTRKAAKVCSLAYLGSSPPSPHHHCHLRRYRLLLVRQRRRLRGPRFPRRRCSTRYSSRSQHLTYAAR